MSTILYQSITIYLKFSDEELMKINYKKSDLFSSDVHGLTGISITVFASEDIYPHMFELGSPI